MTDTPDGVVRKLRELAANIWWSWQPEVRSIFRSLDPELWRAVYQNPVALLRKLDSEAISRRVHDLEMQTRIHQAHRQLREYLETEITWGVTHAGPLMAWPVAYFSAEFGFHHSVPIYSGGLGVLAGDHLKSLSDLGVPAVGIGLLYHQGYVHQEIDKKGRQQDRFEPIEDQALAIEPVRAGGGEQLRIEVELPGRSVHLRVWEIAVGRSRLLLLDARDGENRLEDVDLTARLYGGDNRTRIQQEILLGVGGYRALRAAGVTPSVLHLNEGHSAFALLERAWDLASRRGLTAERALVQVAESSIFTTHTPVEAGHDRFEPQLVAEHLEPLLQKLDLPVAKILAMGQVRPEEPESEFCPTVLALRLAHHRNAVSALHGRVTRRMWHVIFPERSEHEVPIGHITNGVHVRTYLANDMYALLAQYLGPSWLDRITRPQLWAGIDTIPDAELWEVRQVLKSRTLTFVRNRLGDRRKRLGLDPLPALDPEALTIGFARRFATYKRADLLLRDKDRLARLVGDPNRPVQLIFAGKAHPRDEAGKELVQRIASLEDDPRFAGRVVFVENYTMHVARQLVQGVDAWLNTPRRPMEACGTSGQKCIFNGILNISILDGWWAEAFDGENGFAIGTGETHSDPETQDQRAAEAVYSLLENEVVPLYYQRDAAGIPSAWVRRVKRAIRTLAWRFNADRMVMDYVERCYLPAAGGATCRMPEPAPCPAPR